MATVKVTMYMCIANSVWYLCELATYAVYVLPCHLG